MTNPAQLHRRALDETRSVVAGTDRAQWADATPCEGWDVQALLNHLVSGNLWRPSWARATRSKRSVTASTVTCSGTTPWLHMTLRPGRQRRPSRHPGRSTRPAPCPTDRPGSVYAGHRFIDVLIHGWDLATATGQDATLDPELVDAAYGLLEDQADMVRASGMFGEDILVPAGVGPQTQLLAFIGRKG